MSILRNMRRLQRKADDKRIEAYPLELTEVPREAWPGNVEENGRRNRVFLSRSFLVQEFREDAGIIRLSVNRTRVEGDRWAPGIAWADLQAIKDRLGYADRDAVEAFPAQRDVVNVANMRHIWVLPYRLEFLWRAK